MCTLISGLQPHTRNQKKKGHSTLLTRINKLSGCLFFVFKETILPFFHTRLLHCRVVCYSATNTLGKFISWLNIQETCFICASICSFIYNVAKPMSAQCDFCTADWPASLQRVCCHLFLTARIVCVIIPLSSLKACASKLACTSYQRSFLGQ